MLFSIPTIPPQVSPPSLPQPVPPFLRTETLATAYNRGAGCPMASSAHRRPSPHHHRPSESATSLASSRKSLLPWLQGQSHLLPSRPQSLSSPRATSPKTSSSSLAKPFALLPMSTLTSPPRRLPPPPRAALAAAAAAAAHHAPAIPESTTHSPPTRASTDGHGQFSASLRAKEYQ